MDVQLAIPANGTSAFRKMNDHPFPHSVFDQNVGSGFESIMINTFVVLYFDASDAFKFKFIQKAVIHERQRRQNNIFKSIAVFAHHVNAGLASGLLCPLQRSGSNGSKFSVWLIQLIQQKKIGEMK